MTNFMNMLRDDSGASAAEYALILALVGIGIVIAATALGNSIEKSMTDAASVINTRG